MLQLFAVPINHLQQRLHHAARNQRLAAGVVAREMVEEREEGRGQRQRKVRILVDAGRLQQKLHVQRTHVLIGQVFVGIRLLLGVGARSREIRLDKALLLEQLRAGTLPRQRRNAAADEDGQKAVILAGPGDVDDVVQPRSGLPAMQGHS